MTNLFKVNIGDSASAVDDTDEFVEVRESRGKFYVQEIERGDDNRIQNKRTLGRGRRDGEKAIERARSRVDSAIEGINTVEFERQIPSGKFAPEGTRPDASVPPDRGPEGRFVSGRRKPVDSIGRREIDGLFSQFDRPPEAPFRDGPPQLEQNTAETDNRQRTDTLEARFGPKVANERMTPAEDVTAQAKAYDLSLSPDEALEGTGAVGINNSGSGDAPVTDRFARFDKDPEEEQQELDAIAAESETMGAQDQLVEAFNDPSTNIGLREVGEGIASEDQAQDVLSKFVNGD